jgi:peptide/nickel transport system ATP-binding protein
MTEDIVLDVSDLRVEIPTARGVAHIVNGITFQVTPGESVAIVGESGSGKSMTALAIIGLIDRRVVRMSGRVSVVGKEISKERESALRRFRGRHIGMIFQEPTASLNPAFTIGRQLTEKMRLHLGVRDADARRRAHELLDLVRIAAPDRVFNSYPHQLSGGMCQRAMIAMALSCKPDLLIADEPTTALDVTTQAQIVDLVKDIQADMGLGLVWISHDLGVVAGVADRVAVMYAGEFVEVAEADELFARPRHPYTQGLLGALADRRQPCRSRRHPRSATGPDPVAARLPVLATVPSARRLALRDGAPDVARGPARPPGGNALRRPGRPPEHGPIDDHRN